MRPCVTVGIAGGTASGKSWLADFLARELAGQAAVISQDWYYQDHAGVDDARAAELNFDHPDAFDTPLLVAHLDALHEGGHVETPRYDYRTHARVPGPWLAPAPILVLEGILVLHHPDVRRRLQHTVFVETPADVRLARRLKRDAAERALPPEESRRLYETFARPMHDAFVQPSAGWAHDLWRPLDDPQYPQALAAKIKRMV